MKSTQQHYAKTAYEGVMEAAKEGTSSAFACQYGQLCHQFPSLVLTNGLRLAVAFFQAKGRKQGNKNAYQLYLQHMGQAVGSGFPEDQNCIPGRNAEYLHLSRKVLSASVWFKRYAEAVLKVEQEADMELLNEGSQRAEGDKEVQA